MIERRVVDLRLDGGGQPHRIVGQLLTHLLNLCLDSFRAVFTGVFRPPLERRRADSGLRGGLWKVAFALRQSRQRAPFFVYGITHGVCPL